MGKHVQQNINQFIPREICTHNKTKNRKKNDGIASDEIVIWPPNVYMGKYNSIMESLKKQMKSI